MLSWIDRLFQWLWGLYDTPGSQQARDRFFSQTEKWLQDLVSGKLGQTLESMLRWVPWILLAVLVATALVAVLRRLRVVRYVPREERVLREKSWYRVAHETPVVVEADAFETQAQLQQEAPYDEAPAEAYVQARMEQPQGDAEAPRERGRMAAACVTVAGCLLYTSRCV